jgi:hypothetical protein
MEKKTGVKPQSISRLENPYYGKASLSKRIAAACDVGLVVEFVPYSQFADRASGTPEVEVFQADLEYRQALAALKALMHER